ncbi:hypothetical protein ACFX13_040844 [Malus domestica]
MQEKLQAMKLEKEKTLELLKEKDEILKTKEEDLAMKGREQDKLQMELKKLQKLKEFKPTIVCFLNPLSFLHLRLYFFMCCIILCLDAEKIYYESEVWLGFRVHMKFGLMILDL